ncbi:hypothetical protein AT4G03495 [Arabidopsis thaliana]|uniref:Uncharacterized protein n=1 Tax=Arabidopsis thaliana TaxID=3702 RepID=A0A1P8B3L9_ARATH|nr:uncharacterized protein AT4G03495 [Arabidopsis thaliana]ANM66190.1 hypothetical protein AT4G03495 [Arabidopsis thaliana]|eukprot:NP_001328099.1 hypothetical protein AT4G03495 [Arabidopsis thaliana]
MALINAGAPRSSSPVSESLRSFKPEGFTLPGGHKGSVPNLGMATLAQKTAFQFFLELVDLRNQHLPSTYSVLKNSGFLIVLQRATIMSMQQQMNEDTSELVIEASDHNG